MIIKIITLLLLSSSCQQDEYITFNDKNFYSNLENEKHVEFIRCLKEKKDFNCLETYPKFDSLGYKQDLYFPNGNRRKLTQITEPMVQYINKESLNEFIALAVYLYDKGYSSKKLYDDMLEIGLKLDSTNIIANYELAKVRCNEGYLGLAHFLINEMNNQYPENLEITRLKNEIDNKFGDNTYDKTMDYKEYLELNPHYIPSNE